MIVEVQERRHSLAQLSHEAQIPRLPDGKGAAARPGRQESLSRLDRGERGHLDSKVGVDVLDVLIAIEGGDRRPRRGHRHDGAAGVDTHDKVDANTMRMGAPVVVQVSSTTRDGRTRGA